MTKTAIFLDRDGTLIVDKHYLSDPQEVELIPRARDALQLLESEGFLLFLHTNQSGIARGYYSWEDVYACHKRMFELLGWESSRFQEICIAPECEYHANAWRKPSDRFPREMAEKYHLDLARSWMVGDRPVDWQTARAAGLKAAALCCGHPFTTEEKADLRRKGVSVWDDLYAFAQAMVHGQ